MNFSVFGLASAIIGASVIGYGFPERCGHLSPAPLDPWRLGDRAYGGWAWPPWAVHGQRARAVRRARA